MSEQFIGCTVSIEAGGGLGFYQGLVKGVNTENQLIKLSKVLHNGKPLQIPEVSLRAKDIVDLKILHTKEENEQNINIPLKKSASNQSKASIANSETPLKVKEIPNSTEHLPIFHIAGTKTNTEPKDQTAQQRLDFKPIQDYADKKESSKNQVIQKKKSRTSVGETLAHGNLACNDFKISTTTTGGSTDYSHQRRNQDYLRTPNRKQLRKNYRDETTFGFSIDDDINTEFDFEKNLALFDKQAIMEEIQGLRPDVIKQAVGNTERQYRCDENIITGKPVSQRQIIVPGTDAGEMLYVTDNGLLVPSVTKELRINLLSTANQLGLTTSRQLEMIGRAATEIIVSVIGGSHRLEPGNSHQPPVVVLMCGVNMQGAAGLNCARQLESQGVQTVVTTPPNPGIPPQPSLLSQEAQLFAYTSGKHNTDATLLPSTVDLIVDARFDLQGHLGINSSNWVTATNAWALVSRAPIVALDSPASFDSPLSPRIRLCPSLPLSYPPEKGKIYLLNLNIPQQIFASLGIKYISPFGAKMVIPLHPCE